jgi:hypothetical protein
MQAWTKRVFPFARSTNESQDSVITFPSSGTGLDSFAWRCVTAEPISWLLKPSDTTLYAYPAPGVVRSSDFAALIATKQDCATHAMHFFNWASVSPELEIQPPYCHHLPLQIEYRIYLPRTSCLRLVAPPRQPPGSKSVMGRMHIRNSTPGHLISGQSTKELLIFPRARRFGRFTWRHGISIKIRKLIYFHLPSRNAW